MRRLPIPYLTTYGKHDAYRGTISSDAVRCVAGRLRFRGHAHWIKVDESSVMPIGALNGWSRDEAEWLGVCDPDDIEDFLSECSTIRRIA